jgi:LAS superfamily LD-carboxypeptidase LdcB
MNHIGAARTEARGAPGILLVGLAVVIAVATGALVHRSAPSSEPPFNEVGRTTPWDDGVLPDGVTVFDDEYPGVANLDSSLLQALRNAASGAADDGIELQVNSGWRSAEYQEQLFREAVSEYGSEEEATRWVATADTSAHVSGDAVDIGPFEATAWLSEHGARYGLCQVYRHESWHYELRPEATSLGCPRMEGPGDDLGPGSPG